mgnify:CR=1 FL=1
MAGKVLELYSVAAAVGATLHVVKIAFESLPAGHEM